MITQHYFFKINIVEGIHANDLVITNKHEILLNTPVIS